jgi:hypothetical protein
MAGNTWVLKPMRWHAYGKRGSQLTAKKRHCQQLGPGLRSNGEVLMPSVSLLQEFEHALQ